MSEPAAGVQDSPLDPRLEDGWKAALAEELRQPYMHQLRQRLVAERAAGRTTYPPARLIFHAFDRTPFDQVRVVIVGQDPYHGPAQAMGLSFSVPRGVVVPPSLRNVFREIEDDLGLPRPAHGDLTHWADQGVLLLNTSLTVGAGEAGSHADWGWSGLTDAAIRALSQGREGIVFLLWGRHAQAKRALVDEQRHLVLVAPHPSPLSASRGFIGCRHFSRANEWMAARGATPIDWSLPA
jgi:uracil-DNA glycosylase